MLSLHFYLSSRSHPRYLPSLGVHLALSFFCTDDFVYLLVIAEVLALSILL